MKIYLLDQTEKYKKIERWDLTNPQGWNNLTLRCSASNLAQTIHAKRKENGIPASYILFAAPCDSHKRNMQWNSQANPIELPQLTGSKQCWQVTTK